MGNVSWGDSPEVYYATINNSIILVLLYKQLKRKQLHVSAYMKPSSGFQFK